MFDLTPFRYQRMLRGRDVPSLRDPDGRHLCRWCHQPVPKGRRNWCSQGCVDEYLLRSSPREAAHRVFKRDKGVCSACGIDTVALKTAMRDYRQLLQEHRMLWRSDAARATYGPWAARSGNVYWEADHILPVQEGGGVCALENYRTLCVRCHKAETKALAGRRAKRKKIE